MAYRKYQGLTLLKPGKWQPWTPNELQRRILTLVCKGCQTAALDASRRTEGCGHSSRAAAAEELTLGKASKRQPSTPNELQRRILGILRAAQRQPGMPVKEQKAVATVAEADDWNLVTAGTRRTQRASLNASFLKRSMLWPVK